MATTLLGITGFIASGKSYVAQCFRTYSIPVFDADATVHILMRENDGVMHRVARAFPETVRNGVIQRELLADIVFTNPLALNELESILHPAIKQEFVTFITHHKAQSTPLIVVDAPLLYEAGWHAFCAAVLWVSSPQSVRMKRVCNKRGWTKERFHYIESLRRTSVDFSEQSDYIIDGTAPEKRLRVIVRNLIDTYSHA